MILLIAGTKDGRKLAGFLIENNIEIIISVISNYGKELLQNYDNIKINDKKLDTNELVELIFNEKIKLLIDASHPYAVNISKNAMTACNVSNIPYIRYEREEVPITYEKVFIVDSYELAAMKAATLGKNIFLTIGSRNLKTFANSSALTNCNLIARILPTTEVLAECEKLNFMPMNIVAMQGPFSRELNRELFKHYNAEVIVTKNSGQVGGADTKLLAAEDLNLPVVMIDRPKINYDNIAFTFNDILSFIKKNL